MTTLTKQDELKFREMCKGLAKEHGSSIEEISTIEGPGGSILQIARMKPKKKK